MSSSHSKAKRQPIVKPRGLSSKLINALSPSGNLYGILWPIIIEQATKAERRRCLRQVNTFFACECRRILSDIAKDHYLNKISGHLPESLKLDLPSDGEYWASFSASSIYFESIKEFYLLCAMAQFFSRQEAIPYNLYQSDDNSDDASESQKQWIFVSNSRDLFFESSEGNPRLRENDSTDPQYEILNFAVTGTADVVEEMFEYVVAPTHNISSSRLKWGTHDFVVYA